MKILKTTNYKKVAVDLKDFLGETKISQRIDGYFQGDAYVLTGEWQKIHGGIFLNAILVEGHKKGETIVIPERKHPNYLEEMQNTRTI